MLHSRGDMLCPIAPSTDNSSQISKTTRVYFLTSLDLLLSRYLVKNLTLLAFHRGEKSSRRLFWIPRQIVRTLASLSHLALRFLAFLLSRTLAFPRCFGHASFCKPVHGIEASAGRIPESGSFRWIGRRYARREAKKTKKRKKNTRKFNKTQMSSRKAQWTEPPGCRGH